MLEYFVYALFFVIGACIGSFSNVVIFRYPQGISLDYPESTCFSCQKKLHFYDNIPILSFLLLGGKCRYCGAKIGVRVLIIECLTAFLYLQVALTFFEISLSLAIILCLCISILLILSCIDLDYMYVPTVFLILLLILGIAMIFVSPYGKYYDHIIGFCVGGGFLLIVYGIGYLIKKKEVIGLGDIQLMAVGGLILGWKGILIAYLIAFLSATIFICIRFAQRVKDRANNEMPFVPFLAFGIIIAMFYGNTIFDFYISLFVI